MNNHNIDRMDLFQQSPTLREQLDLLIRERTKELYTRNKELEEEVANLRQAAGKESLLHEKLESNLQLLEEANKEIEAFGYSISHDLRAPLRAIHGYAGILAEEFPVELDGNSRKILQAIQSNSSYMGHLIDDLLSFVQIGRRELNKQEIDMNELVKAVINEMHHSYPGFNANIKIEELPLAFADPKCVFIAVSHLFSNAIKFSSPCSAPCIHMGSLSGVDNEVVYYIRDNGVGFDMKYYPKLFGVFQRLHGRDQFEGTGIGLVIIKRIVNRHGGRVWAIGEIEKGATFYFTFPGQKELKKDLEIG